MESNDSPEVPDKGKTYISHPRPTFGDTVLGPVPQIGDLELDIESRDPFHRVKKQGSISHSQEEERG